MLFLTRNRSRDKPHLVFYRPSRLILLLHLYPAFVTPREIKEMARHLPPAASCTMSSPQIARSTLFYSRDMDWQWEAVGWTNRGISQPGRPRPAQALASAPQQSPPSHQLRISKLLQSTLASKQRIAKKHAYYPRQRSLNGRRSVLKPLLHRLFLRSMLDAKYELPFRRRERTQRNKSAYEDLLLLALADLVVDLYNYRHKKGSLEAIFERYVGMRF